MICKKPLIKELFFLSSVIAVLHFMALKLFLYWTVSWFDIMMHILGGFFIGLAVMFILINFIGVAFLSHKKLVFILTLSGVLVVGLAWELWEIFFGMTDIFEDQLDTVIDIVMDSLGAFFAFLYSKKYLWDQN